MICQCENKAHGDVQCRGEVTTKWATIWGAFRVCAYCNTYHKPINYLVKEGVAS